MLLIHSLFFFFKMANYTSLTLTGYTRIILAAVSLHFMSFHPRYCTITYCISWWLDAFDGQAARALGQTSKFGAVLDMVTDRWGPLSTSPYAISLNVKT